MKALLLTIVIATVLSAVLSGCGGNNDGTVTNVPVDQLKPVGAAPAVAPSGAVAPAAPAAPKSAVPNAATNSTP